MDPPFEDVVPECFKIVRTTRDGNIYNDLTSYQFTLEEKLWICDEAVGEHSPRPDILAGNKKGLIRRYGLYSSWFKKNWASYLVGNLSLKGGQAGLDGLAVKLIKDAIMVARHAVAPINEVELRKLINDGMFNTMLRRGNVNPAFQTAKSTTIATMMIRYGFKCSSPGAIQEAQVAACKDLYMSYMWYLICYACSNKLLMYNKWNIDATTHVFMPAGNGSKAISLLKEKEYKIDIEDKITLLQEVKTLKKGHKLPYAIKNMMMMIAASGECSEFALLVVVKELGPDEWYCEEVPQLSISVTVGTKGIIYFSRARCGTAALWRDYFLRVCVPTAPHASAIEQWMKMVSRSGHSSVVTAKTSY